MHVATANERAMAPSHSMMVMDPLSSFALRHEGSDAEQNLSFEAKKKRKLVKCQPKPQAVVYRRTVIV